MWISEPWCRVLLQRCTFIFVILYHMVAHGDVVPVHHSSIVWWASTVAGKTQGKELNQDKIRLLLQEVLLRVTGTAEIFMDKEVQSMLKDPDRYVVSHSVLPATAKHPERLAVEFSQQQITDELMHHGIAILNNHPKILVLLVKEDQLLPLPPALLSPLLAEGRIRGFTMVSPVSGASGLALEAPTGRFFSAPATLWRNLIMHSSVDGVLLVKVDVSQQTEEISWRIISHKMDRQFATTSDDVLSFWPFLADQTAEVLAGEQLWPDLYGNKVSIEVQGVEHFKDSVIVHDKLMRAGFSDLELVKTTMHQQSWLGVETRTGALMAPSKRFPDTIAPRWINAWSMGSPYIHLLWNAQDLLPDPKYFRANRQ